jgi:hypothetical protein
MNLSCDEPALMNGVPFETLHPIVGPTTQMMHTYESIRTNLLIFTNIII